MQHVTITQTAHAHYAPTLGGGPVWQPARTIITTHIAGEFVEVEDSRVTSHVHNLLGSLVRLDLTDLTPTELTTHDAICGYWYAEALRWAAEAATMESEVAA
jgi:hypothetical protein